MVSGKWVLMVGEWLRGRPMKVAKDEALPAGFPSVCVVRVVFVSRGQVAKRWITCLAD